MTLKKRLTQYIQFTVGIKSERERREYFFAFEESLETESSTQWNEHTVLRLDATDINRTSTTRLENNMCDCKWTMRIIHRLTLTRLRDLWNIAYVFRCICFDCWPTCYFASSWFCPKAISRRAVCLHCSQRSVVAWLVYCGKVAVVGCRLPSEGRPLCCFVITMTDRIRISIYD